MTGLFTHVCARRRTTIALVAMLLVMIGAWLQAGAAASEGADQSVTVTFAVLSQTSISPTSCTGSALDLGTVLPGVPTYTSSDCELTFGSTNSTSKLRLYQQDGTGDALIRPSTGAPDSTWNAAPAGLRDISPAPGGSSEHGGLAVLADGKVLKGGSNGSQLFITRFNTDGSTDTTLTQEVGASGTTARALVAGPDGSSYIIGDTVFGGVRRIAVVKFSPTGVLDTAWGVGGTPGVDGDGIAIATAEGSVDASASSAVLLGDGSLVIQATSDGVNRAFIAKFTADGQLDTGFGGGDGLATWQATSTESNYTQLAVFPDGDLLSTFKNASSITWLRWTPAGTLRTTWGTSGVRTISTSPSVNATMTLNDGSVLTISDNAGSSQTFVKLTPAGGPDTAWAPSGIRAMPTPPGASSTWYDAGTMVPVGDGRFYVAGDANVSGMRYVIARFNADGSLDTTFGTNGFTTLSAASVESHGGGLAVADGAVYAGGGNGTRMHVVRLATGGPAVRDYLSPTRTFATTTGAFGACLRTSSAATPTWTPAPGGVCAGDGSHWNGIARTSSDATAQVATAASTVNNARVALRFGVRLPMNQPPGGMIAPLVAEVIAP